MIALLPNSAQHAACLLSFPALITALLLFSSTFLMAEDWPLNGLPLYPYNARQIGKLESLFGRYLLAHSDGKGRESSICLTELCVSACPAICFPGHFKALEAAWTWTWINHESIWCVFFLGFCFQKCLHVASIYPEYPWLTQIFVGWSTCFGEEFWYVLVSLATLLDFPPAEGQWNELMCPDHK